MAVGVGARSYLRILRILRDSFWQIVVFFDFNFGDFKVRVFPRLRDAKRFL